MNYELAKQLKDAGFPMPKKVRAYCVHKKHSKFEEDLATADVELPNKTAILLPTLSELIDACGRSFYQLSHTPDAEDLWEADGWRNGYLITEIGKTPEESVARLWLELNEK